MAYRDTPRCLAALGAGLALLFGAPSPAPAAAPGSTVLVDRPTGFGALPFDGNNDSFVYRHPLSADGRFLAFVSDADALFPGDDNAATNVYRLDRETGQVAQVNTTAQGAQSSLGSRGDEPSISAEGRFVAFQSDADNLVGGAPPRGVYVKDMDTGAVVLASRSTGADGASSFFILSGVIAGDGRHVAFTAAGAVHAINADGKPDEADAYVRDLDAGTTRMASVSNQGAEAGGVTAAPPDIDFHGDAVAFITTTRLNDDDGVNDPDAYVRTGIGTTAETTRLASIFTNQISGHATAASEVAVASNGSGTDLRVAWSSIELYMTSVKEGAAVAPATRMDVARAGGSDGGDTGQPVFEPVSSAADHVEHLDFLDAGGLDPADDNGQRDAYLTSVTFPGSPASLLTSGKANAHVDSGAGAATGSVVAFNTNARNLPGADGIHDQAYVRTVGGDVNISQPLGAPPRADDAGSASLGDTGVSSARAIDDDGGVVAFTSAAPALGSPLLGDLDVVRLDEVLIRDVASGATTLASAAPDGTAADGNSTAASIDAAGDRVAFRSTATNLAPGENPTRRPHAFVRDLAGNHVTLIDRAPDGKPLAAGISQVRISADGRHAIYLSTSPDAPGAPPGGNDHVYEVNLATGATELVDRANDGTASNARAINVDIDGDGSRVAFTSPASNLGAGAGTGAFQAYVRDLAAQTTTWASTPASGAASDSSAGGPLSLDRAGTRVAFQQSDPQFGFGMTTVPQVFVRDLDAKTTVLASRGPDDPADSEAGAPSLSADGRRLTFLTAATNFPAAVPRRTQIYLRDLTARSTTAVSLRAGADAGARLGADDASLSGNGACVAFSSVSDDLVNPSYGPDFGHVFLRAVSADCPAVSVADGPGDGGAGAGDSGDRALDTTPPSITRARLIHRRFAVRARRTALSARAARGTTIAFTLSEDARTTIAITRSKPGRRSGTRCVKARRGLKHRCTRTVTLFTLTRPGAHAGANRVAFSGRTKRATLRQGSYRARLTARDRAGNRSKTVTLKFAVVRR
jgi:hypothetical protein